jgi:hypothetical protein
VVVNDENIDLPRLRSHDHDQSSEERAEMMIGSAGALDKASAAGLNGGRRPPSNRRPT